MASNNSKAPLLVGISIAVASMGAGVFLALGSGGSDSGSARVAGSAVAVPAVPAQVIAAPPQAIAEPAEVAVAEPPPGPAGQPAIRRNRMTRDVKREQIWSALGREHKFAPAAPGSAAPEKQAAANLPALDPEYIRSAISEQLLPVAIECYESALADDPKLAGKIVTEFTIVGAEEVGGIVEEASIRDDESTLDSEFVRECMRESLMAVTFEPPADGGQVQVTYPFEFAP
jgi:hypothetical protein